MTTTSQLRKIAVSATLPVAWHLSCRFAGASLDGYHRLDEISVAQGIMAFRYAIGAMFYSAWQYAFAYPAAVFVLFNKEWRSLSTKVALVGVLMSVFMFAIVFALSDAVDFEWHLESLERILWVPSLVLVRELLDVTKVEVKGGGEERTV